MRIHTNTIDSNTMYSFVRDLDGVYFAVFSEHGSRSHTRAFEIQLEGNSSHTRQSGEGKAATWDEWGIFISRIFDAEPGVKMSYYANANDFHFKTGNRFKTLSHDEQCKRHKWINAGGNIFKCNKGCGATQRYHETSAA